MQIVNYKRLVAAALVTLTLLAAAPRARADQTPVGVPTAQTAITAPSDAATSISSADTASLPGRPNPGSQTSTSPQPQAGADGPTPEQTPPGAIQSGQPPTSTASQLGQASVSSTTESSQAASSNATQSGDASSSSASQSGEASGSNATPPSGDMVANPTPSTSEPTASPAQSNQTVQTIWQVQSLGCTAHCQGTTQSQSAQQASTTVEFSAAAPHTTSSPGTSTGAGTSEQSTTNVTQIQVGCSAYCFGTTTVATGGGQSEQTVEQLLNAAAAPPPSGQDPASWANENLVYQNSIQVQDGQGVADMQTQMALQSNITLQETESASSQSPTGQVVNQVEQTIWQLQVGCLFYCSQTNQSQQAEQSDTTLWVSPDSTGSTPGSSATVQTHQIVWQLQIGCLFWCWNAVQTQTVTTSSQIGTVFPASLAAPAEPAPTSGGASGDGVQQQPSGQTPTGSAPSGPAPSVPLPSSATAPTGPPPSVPATIGPPPSIEAISAPSTTLIGASAPSGPVSLPEGSGGATSIVSLEAAEPVRNTRMPALGSRAAFGPGLSSSLPEEGPAGAALGQSVSTGQLFATQPTRAFRNPSSMSSRKQGSHVRRIGSAPPPAIVQLRSAHNPPDDTAIVLGLMFLLVLLWSVRSLRLKSVKRNSQ